VSTTTPDADLRCPQCAAHVRAGSDWCTLCYADLRPAPAPVASAPAPEPGPVVTGVEVVDPAEPAIPATRRGKHAKQSQTVSSPTETEQLAAQLVAQLAAHESGSPLGRFSHLTDTPAKKVGMMIGGCVAVLLVLTSLMFLLGMLV
jgi:hypothetical protein